MSGLFNSLVGAQGFVELTVAASNVSRTVEGVASGGTVTTIALPNTTIRGGVAPYTQVWTRQSGDNPTISDASALNPTWSAEVNDDVQNISFWLVTVTDAIGGTASADIQIKLTWNQA